MLSDVYEEAAERFDLIHTHIDYWSFPSPGWPAFRPSRRCTAGWMWRNCIRSMRDIAAFRWYRLAMLSGNRCRS